MNTHLHDLCLVECCVDLDFTFQLVPTKPLIVGNLNERSSLISRSYIFRMHLLATTTNRQAALQPAHRAKASNQQQVLSNNQNCWTEPRDTTTHWKEATSQKRTAFGTCPVILRSQANSLTKVRPLRSRCIIFGSSVYQHPRATKRMVQVTVSPYLPTTTAIHHLAGESIPSRSS